MSTPINSDTKLFEQALGLSTESERVAFLKQACQDNQDQFERILTLLNNADEAKQLFDTELMGHRDTAPPQIVGPGTKIGRFRLLQQIGEGGFGIVYMAEQQEPVIRKVALKIIKPGMDSKQVIARFESERQALALMDHPHIAQVHDGGTTDSGRPYFVMELVSGIPITQFCDESRYSTKQRLELFQQVCAAVQHAHQKGVIHRDLKPSNILVTLNGDQAVPKIIDFGIAKAVNQRLTDKTLFTQFQQFMGTPAYMSPEQASLSGLDIDTRSDVYSLGILLYELLVGKPPFDNQTLLSKGYDEIRRIIREVDAPRPSNRLQKLSNKEQTRTAHQRRSKTTSLTSLIRGELDWIVMKSLEKNRTRRYETANNLAEDIQRFLNNEPVYAVAPSRLYQLQKFVTRNKAALILTGALASVLMIASVFSFWQAYRAHTALDSLGVQLTYTEDARQEAETAKERALASEQRASRNLEALRIQRGQDLIKNDRADDALAWLAFAARNNPTNKLLADNLVGNLLFAPKPRPLLPPMVHGDQVQHLEYSPDGTRLASASLWGGTAKLWDAKTGNAIGDTIQHQSPIHRIQFNPDGTLLATASHDSTAALWNTDTATASGVPFQHQGKVFDLAFSPDGRHLATASEDSYVRVWNVKTGQAVGSPLPHGGPVRTLAYSPKGKWLATGSNDQTVVIWDAASLAKVKVIPHQSELRLVQFSPSGALLLTASQTASRVWDSESWNPVTPRFTHSRTHDFAFNPQETKFATVTFMPGKVTLYDIPTGTVAGEPIRHPYNPIWHAEFSPDGQRLVTSGYDKTVRIWDVETRVPLGPPIKMNTPYEARFSPDGVTLAVSSSDGTIALWDTRPTAARIAGFNHPHWIQRLKFRPNSHWFLTGDQDGTARIWDAQSLSLKFSLEFEGAEWGIHDIVFNSEGDKAIIARGPEYARVWDVDSGKPVGPKIDLSDSIWKVQFSRQGDHIAAVSVKGEIGVWDGPSGERIAPPIASGAEGSDDLQFSNNGQRIAVCADTSLEVIDSPTGKRLFPPLLHPARLRAVSFSPSDDYMVSTCDDGFLRFWDTETGALIGDPLFTGGGIGRRKIQFSPDGRALASTSEENQVHIWDPKTRTLLSPAIQLDYVPRRIHFTPDSQRLLVWVGETDGYLQLWEVATALPVGPAFGPNERFNPIDLSSDGKWAVAGGYYGAALFELPNAPIPIPREFLDFAEAIAGKRIAQDERTIESIGNQSIQELREEFSNDLADDYFGKLMGWLLSDPHERPLTPNHSATPAAYQDFLLSQGDLKSFQDCLKYNPTNGVASARIASHYLRTLDESDRFNRQRVNFHLAHAQRWAVDQADTHLAMALSHFSLGDLEEAEREADTALLTSASDPDVWDLKARIAINGNRPEEALAAWTQAIILGQVTNHPRLELFERRQAEWFKRLGRIDDFAKHQEDRLGIRPRDPATPAKQLDLSLAYNTGLTTKWRQTRRAHLREFATENNRTFDGIRFDARGITHLFSQFDESKGFDYPQEISSLPVNQRASRIHVLHSAKHVDRNDPAETVLARYRIRYADKTSHSFEVKTNIHVQDWRFEKSLPHHLEANEKLGAVWIGKCYPSNTYTHRQARLFKTSWDNPFPSKEIVAIDLVSAETEGGVFVLGITLE